MVGVGVAKREVGGGRRAYPGLLPLARHAGAGCGAGSSAVTAERGCLAQLLICHPRPARHRLTALPDVLHVPRPCNACRGGMLESAARKTYVGTPPAYRCIISPGRRLRVCPPTFVSNAALPLLPGVVARGRASGHVSGRPGPASGQQPLQAAWPASCKPTLPWEASDGADGGPNQSRPAGACMQRCLCAHLPLPSSEAFLLVNRSCW